jgi:CheY-like chemotaxis protein
MLPEINGVEIIKKIRAQKRFQKLPVIALSNAFMINLINEAVEAGATKVFNKASSSPRDIVSALGSALFPQLPAEFGFTAGQSQGAPVEAPAGTEPPRRSFAEEAALMPALRMREEGAAEAGKRVPKPAAPAPSSSSGVDPEQLQAQLRGKLLTTAREVIASLRESLNKFGSDASGDAPRVLSEMSRSVHSLTGKAAIAGAANLAHFSSAVAALLKELSRKPKNLNISSKQTLVRAVDALGDAIQQGTESRSWVGSKVLVVDDDGICRETLRSALDLADLPSIVVGEPDLALKLLEENRFGLILLDVGMPGTNGFELSDKIRALPQHKRTPVVFVTALDDVDNRNRASASGACDFIGKPYLLVEMAVKALTYLSTARREPAAMAA